MGDKFNSKEDSSYLQYLDTNNLYGSAMIQPLLTGEFHWVDQNEFTSDKIDSYANWDSEIDVRYSKELYDVHNDLSFMCVKMKTNGVGCARAAGVEKLFSDLYDKNNYAVHIKALNQSLKHGLILKKVYRVIEFNQSSWLKPYIDFNTQLRTQAKNDFGKDFFQVMNNSVFSKTRENIKKHKDIKLVTNMESFLKTVMKPNFKSAICSSSNLMGCEMGKTQMLMNKPVYLDQATLDVSKLIMYEFYYDYMIPKYTGGTGTAYRENLKLCYMDTDYLVYRRFLI